MKTIIISPQIVQLQLSKIISPQKKLTICILQPAFLVHKEHSGYIAIILMFAWQGLF